MNLYVNEPSLTRTNLVDWPDCLEFKKSCDFVLYIMVGFLRHGNVLKADSGFVTKIYKF